MNTHKFFRNFKFRRVPPAVFWFVASMPLAAQPAGNMRELTFKLFGKTAHLQLSVGTLGLAVILMLTALFLLAAVLTVIARRRAKEAEAANRKLNIEIEVRKRAEEEIRSLNADLERRVAERTAQLGDANKQLEAFSYSVAHDLKAPLRAVSGFSNALMEDYGSKLDGEARQYLHSIARGAKTMGKLIDDLLAFSRQGLKEMEPSRIDMDEMAKSVFEELRRAAPERKLECRLNSLPSARGDRAMVRQIWVNLLSNAIKFTEPKDYPVIEAGCAETSGDQNIYYVKDNGAGFDMSYADKLFGIFQRLHSGKDFEGTGVGLAIVRRIVQRHGGRIWAEGRVNEGATFHFTLPAEGEEHELSRTGSASC
jgi:light-regulated signal transduction histidine kinase (bacteriophytochrome)